MFEEYVLEYCQDQFHLSHFNLTDFVHYFFKKYGSYLLNNNSLYLNWEYSFATFEILNEIVSGESILNPISEIDWAQMFAALFVCHAGRTHGSNGNDRIESAAVPHPKRGIHYQRIDSDNNLWQFMVPRALSLAEEISKEFHLIDISAVKSLIRHADPFQLTRCQDRTFDILRSSVLIPMLSDPRLKYKFLLFYRDLEEGGVLKKLKISDPSQLRTFITEEFWDTSYLQIFHGLQALEKTSRGKNFLSYLYANVVPNEKIRQMMFKKGI